MDAEERALLAAIIAHAEEDTPRLVYADWLDENADSLPKERQESARARAELIRLQIERSNLIFGAKGFEERDWALGDRIVELEQDYARTWVNELPTEARGRGLRFEFDRGLFGEVECTVNYFVGSSRALMDAAPVTAVRLKGLTVRNLTKLAKCPHFPRLRSLKAYADSTAQEALLALLNQPRSPLLRGLFLSSPSIDETTEDWYTRCDGIAQLLSEAPRFASLRHLDFYASGVGRAGGEALARSTHLANLEVLDLRENPVLGVARKALRKQFGKRVWLDHEDKIGFAVRYVHRHELPGG